MVDLVKIQQGLVARGFNAQYGYLPNGVTFMYEGGSYYIDVDVNDASYVRIGFANFYQIAYGTHGKAYVAANKVTESMKAVKVYLIGDGVYCSIEQYVKDEQQVFDFLMRYLVSLQAGVKAFAEQLSKG